MKYYVYQLIDPRSNTVFYIGKGTGNRAHTHNQFTDGNNNYYKDSLIKELHKQELEPVVEIIKYFVDEQLAYDYEEHLIETIGISNLTNITEGARPPVNRGADNGFYGKTHTPENKIKSGNSNRGKDTKTLAGRNSISASMKTRWQDEDYRKQQIELLESRKGEKRSSAAIESYKIAAQQRVKDMSPEKRSDISKRAAETRKKKYEGMKRKQYIDDAGNKRFTYVAV